MRLGARRTLLQTMNCLCVAVCVWLCVAVLFRVG